MSCRIRGFHSLWPPIPRRSSTTISSHITGPTTLILANEFRLFRFRSPLLTESLLIYFPHPTEMFQFGWYPAYHYDSLRSFYDRLSRLLGMGCPIRKPSDYGIMTPPRRLSRSYTSFLGMNTLGIHCQLVALQRTKDAKLIALLFFFQQN